uniref:Uncharacterized protein n=1 Tax=Magallana gigas TaxID=29159 RepID=K1QY00_MAGGI
MEEKSKLRYTEIDGVETTDIENFPYSAIKALGAVQIGLGVTCLVLGLLDVFLYLFMDDDQLATAGDSTLMTLTIASSPIWCGLWWFPFQLLGHRWNAALVVGQHVSCSRALYTFQFVAVGLGKGSHTEQEHPPGA